MPFKIRVVCALRASVALIVAALGSLAVPASGATIFNNLTQNNLMAIATRPSGSGAFEIEAGDDFVLTSKTAITSAAFAGLVTLGTGSTPSPSQVIVEIYRVFPQDSNIVRTPKVPTRVNSPSDDAFDSRDSAASELSFSTTILANSFTALNSIQPGGIHPSPTQTTGGNGPVSGQEVQFDVNFTTPLTLAPGHYFFVPQVQESNGGQFYWLSAARPISGAGTTPFAPDLQAWTRDEALAPDWLRVGTDIVGGEPTSTFNAAFSLEGMVVVPEASSVLICSAGMILFGLARAARRR